MALRQGSKSLTTRILAQPRAFEPVGTAFDSSHDGSLNVEGKRHASNEALKLRMKSVSSIMKITKAMKMVAASKLRGAQIRATKSRGIAEPVVAVLGDTSGSPSENNVFVPITSDRGLCGGINSTMAKVTRFSDTILADMAEGEYNSKVVMVGDKGRALMMRDYSNKFVANVNDVTKNIPNFAGISMIADEVLQTDYDAAHVVFNKFRSAISFIPTVATVPSTAAMAKAAEESGSLDAYELEGPEKGEFLQDLGEFQLAATLYNAVCENACSENGARMQAMENSSTNASDMLDRLTLTYNRSRQAAITTELIEIISGAAALDG